MYTVTDAFKDAVVADSRETKAKVEFEIVDVDAAADATASVTSEETFSRKSQLYNGIRQMSGKYATSENDYLLLDGSFVLPPKASETDFEVGWWSDLLCGSNGVFSTPQVCTTNFTTDHSSIGLTITFDTLTEEYAEDFTIVYKDSGGSTLHTETVTGNTLSYYVLEHNVSNFRSVVITITKWANGNRRARITEIDFGVIKQYTDDEIASLNLIEEVDTISNTISSNELKVTIDNVDKDFNILNPDGIYPYLQRRQKLKAYLGTVITDTLTEYVPMGVFYLVEPKSDEDAMTVTFKARDIIDLLTQNNFAETVYSSKSLTYILEDILDNAGVTDYEIDSALNSIVVSGTLPESTHREAIQTAAIAGQAVVYSDRRGMLRIKQLSTATPVATIDQDNMYKTPAIKLDKLINTVVVKYGSSYHALVDPDKPSSEQVLLVTIDNPLIGTLAHAQNVATWILAELKKRFLYEVNWRQNQSLEASDLVTIEDEFDENKTAVITKQEWTYDGALSGKTTAKGDGT